MSTPGASWRRCADALAAQTLITSAPRGSLGYTLEIGNPYGEPKRFILDLGR